MKHAASVALLVSLGIGVYLPGLPGGFVFDDYPNILENESLRLERPTPASLLAAAFSSEAGVLKRPLAMLSFAAGYAAFGHSPLAYKLTNIAIHVANALLLYAFLNLVAAVPAVSSGGSPPPRDARSIALIAAALWVVHPINLSSVLYVVQRMNSLAALFALLGTYCYLRGRLQLLAGSRGFGVLAAGTLGCAALGMLAKENAVLLFAFVAVVELCLFRLRTATPRGGRLLCGYFVLVVGLPALLCVTFLLANPDWLASRYAGRPFTLSERLLTETRVLWFYLRLVFVPSNSAFGLFHDDFPVSTGLFAPPATALAAAGLAGALALALAAIPRYPVASLGVLWFLAGHVLESTVLPLELVHEHRNYLPAAGLIFAFVHVIWTGVRDGRVRPVLRGALVALTIAWSTVTVARASQWADPLVLATLEAEHHPGSARTRYELGRMYLLLHLAGQDDEFLARARANLARAAALDQANPLPLFGLLQLDYQAGGEPDTGVMAALIARLHTQPYRPATAHGLARLIRCQHAGPCRDAPDDMLRLFGAVTGNPLLSERQRSIILTLLARYYLTAGDAGAAVRIAEDLVAGDPGNLDHRLNLIRALVRSGQWREAREQIAIARADLPPYAWLRGADYGAEIAILAGMVDAAER
jgi:tetratricopeptide (TPR) repeat protein